MPDRQAVDLWRYPAGWNFALNRQLGDPRFHPTRLVNFRRRLEAQQKSAVGCTTILNALEEAGWYCAVEQQTNLLTAGGWPEFTRVTMDELFMPIAIPGTGARNFFRAVRLPAGPARLSLESAIGPVYRFKLSGQTGAHYSVEMTTSLPSPGPGLPVADLTLTNGWGWFDWTNTGEPRRFFRAVGQ